MTITGGADDGRYIVSSYEKAKERQKMREKRIQKKRGTS